MSDIGLFPPGALVWLVSLAWCCLCLLALIVFLLIAWRRTVHRAQPFARDRFVGYAMGAWFSGIVAGLTMSLINWSGSLGEFARWLDRLAIGFIWLALIVASAPVATVIWNRRQKRRL